VHHGVFRVLEEVVAEEGEDVVVVVLLVEDLTGEDLSYC
jgi:predicted DNA-binding antitoxin AbrB/MazE fold protein